MGKDLADAFPAARDVFERADAALGAPLSQLCFEGPADELTLTHNAQPALLAHGAAVWAVDARRRSARRVVAAAGHSLGEFTAYHAAGSLDARGRGSRRAPARRADVRERREAARRRWRRSSATRTVRSRRSAREATREAGLVVPANYNSPGPGRRSAAKSPASSARWRCARRRARSARSGST